MATLRGAFEARGRRARTVGAERTEELLEDLFRGLERRPLDPHLQKRYIEPFRERAGVFPQARSLVVVASPEPPTPVRFRHRGGGSKPSCLPSTPIKRTWRRRPASCGNTCPRGSASRRSVCP